MLFDTHAHYDDDAFNEDRDTIIDKLQTQGVGAVVNIGASMKSSEQAICLANKYSFFYAAIGVHPDEVGSLTEKDMEWLLEKTANKKVVAIGEIGLDYFRDNSEKEIQEKWFQKQIEIARKVKLPMIIHSRDAAKDTIDILKKEEAEKIGGIIHCYSYSKEMAKEYLDLGFYFGIGGVVTFKNAKKLKEVVMYLPIENILLETDAPYLAPVPFRGKRNESSYLTYVAEEIANIKGLSRDIVIEKTEENAKKIYQL